MDQLVEHSSDFGRGRLNLFQSKILKTFKTEIEEQTELGSFLRCCCFMSFHVSHFETLLCHDPLKGFCLVGQALKTS